MSPLSASILFPARRSPSSCVGRGRIPAFLPLDLLRRSTRISVSEIRCPVASLPLLTRPSGAQLLCRGPFRQMQSRFYQTTNPSPLSAVDPKTDEVVHSDPTSYRARAKRFVRDRVVFVRDSCAESLPKSRDRIPPLHIIRSTAGENLWKGGYMIQQWGFPVCFFCMVLTYLYGWDPRPFYALAAKRQIAEWQERDAKIQTVRDWRDDS